MQFEEQMENLLQTDEFFEALIEEIYINEVRVYEKKINDRKDKNKYTDKKTKIIFIKNIIDIGKIKQETIQKILNKYSIKLDVNSEEDDLEKKLEENIDKIDNIYNDFKEFKNKLNLRKTIVSGENKESPGVEKRDLDNIIEIKESFKKRAL